MNNGLKIKDAAAKPRTFDAFFQFDMQSSALTDEGAIPISVPADGFYYISLSNINLQFTAGYTPNTMAAYLVIDKTESRNSGNVNASFDNQLAKVLFPLDAPESTRPNSRTYHRIQLLTTDKIRISYYDRSFTLQPLQDLSLTIHISSKSSIIRDTL
jgi:hypothetical protein